ncbi:nucleotidyltransferase [Evansella sp. AB-rgal1]|uniref:nucleotidyltransferase n=1 Tax=Evansella sp. AB-rgal1 TaxID=3242696 RepID=UPI00359CD47E
MNILGLIVEYNPFHFGHLHHLKTSQQITDADITIAVMSGSFLQRGEPALTTKWKRTKMALENGVDIVIELPYIFSTQKAEIFSDAAVSLLHSIGANRLCFGSEFGEIDTFSTTVRKVNEHELELNTQIKKYMSDGVSYPRGFSLAFETIFNNEDLIDLSKPNNILGYHYVKSIQKLDSTMIPSTIKREKAEYHDQDVTKGEKIASATSIRKELIERNRKLKEVQSYLPPASTTQLQNHLDEWQEFAHWEKYFPFLQHRIITATVSELHAIYECEEGLEYRLKDAMTKVNSFQTFMEEVKTKRYTWTRLQRLLVHILLNTTKEFMNEYCTPLQPSYLRLLGMSEEGRAYLSSVKKQLSVPLVTRASEWDHPILKKDITASQIHGLPFRISLDEEFKKIPVQYTKEKGTFPS